MPQVKSWDVRTWAIILMVGVFAVVFARADSAYDGVSDLQMHVKAEVRENCQRDNYRVSTGVAAFLTMAKAAEQRQQIWSNIYEAPPLPKRYRQKVKEIAAVQIGTNRIEGEALRNLATALANFEGPDSIDPYSPDLFIRAQKKC